MLFHGVGVFAFSKALSLSQKPQTMASESKSLDIFPAWERLDLEAPRGTFLVIGAPDVGKTSFARYLYRRIRAVLPQVAYLDGDPGQASLGPPTTMMMVIGESGGGTILPTDRVWRSFVGATSPSRHMLQLLVGAARLVQAAYEAGAKVVVYDTTGLIEPSQGGFHLKMAKINLLRPQLVFAIQQKAELEYLLKPLRSSQRVQIIDVPPSPSAKRRDPSVRRAYRAEQFARHFQEAQTMTVDWSSLAVFPAPAFTLNRLVAFEDRKGFTLALGIVIKIMSKSRQVTLVTPLSSLDGVDAIHLGDVELDSQTFEDMPI